MTRAEIVYTVTISLLIFFFGWMATGRNSLSMGKGSEAAALDIKYREIGPGIVEGSYTLKNAGQVSFFFFVLMGMLGHAVFV